jgi:hypothetical protein
MGTKPGAGQDGFAHVHAQAPTCTLDQAGLARQRQRYRRLARSVVDVSRQGEVLSVRLAPSFDRRMLDELVAVEGMCCPFLRFGFDEAVRRLEVSVKSSEFAPTLDALARETRLDWRGQ